MNKKELLFSLTKKDFEIDWFSGKGAGGQYRNKHQNCCRIRHKESGVIGTGQSHRNRKANQEEAFNNLTSNPNFKMWLNKEIYNRSEQKKKDELEIEKKVKEAMKKENIKIEYI